MFHFALENTSFRSKHSPQLEQILVEAAAAVEIVNIKCIKPQNAINFSHTILSSELKALVINAYSQSPLSLHVSALKFSFCISLLFCQLLIDLQLNVKFHQRFIN
jgi:hypothetical protein